MGKLDYRIGVIGVGNMGSALVSGIAISKKIDRKKIFIFDKNTTQASNIAKKNKINKVDSIEELFNSSDIVILAVKPDILRQIFFEIKGYIKNHIIVSVAAGITINEISHNLGANKKIVRVMPNICGLVFESMSGISFNNNIDEKDLNLVGTIFDCIGKTIIVEEKDMDAVVGISGSSPAFIFQIIEAMSDAGVKAGLSRDNAIFMAAQSVLGAAKMVLDTKWHPAQLKDLVTSPAGTTIEGVFEMEKYNVRAGIMSAITQAVEKSKNISKK